MLPVPRPWRLFIALSGLVSTTACSATALRPGTAPLDRIEPAPACVVDGSPQVVTPKVFKPAAVLDGPAVVAVDSDRSIRAWTEASGSDVLDVRVAVVNREGLPVGTPVTIEHEGSAIGEPSVALTPSGQVVVTFVDSTNHGFRRLAASMNCESLVGRPHAVWAMQTTAGTDR